MLNVFSPYIIPGPDQQTGKISVRKNKNKYHNGLVSFLGNKAAFDKMFWGYWFSFL